MKKPEIKLNNPKSLFYIMCGVLSLTILASVAGYYLADKYITDKAKKVSELKADYEILQTSIEESKQTEKKLTELGYLKDIIDEVIPPAKDQSKLIVEISKIAETAGVELGDVNFKATEEKPSGTSQTAAVTGVGGILALPIDTTVSASSFDRAIKFLELIEQNRHKIRVIQLDISPVEIISDTSTTRTYDIQLQMEAYIRAADKPAATSNTAPDTTNSKPETSNE